MENLFKNKYVFWILLGMTVLLVLLRLVHLEADFPQGLTWSGELYTDEGWYSNNAVAKVLTGNWYVEGDENAAINFPVLPFIKAIVFKIFGVSLVSARGIIVVFFVLLLGVGFLLVKRFEDSRTALVFVFLISVSYFWFAYSRLSILEIPMTFFAVLSIWLATYISKGNGYLFTILSAAVLFVAMSTKLTALFAIPILLYLMWRDRVELTKKLIRSLLLLVVLGIGYLIYYLAVVRTYKVDFMYVNSEISSEIPTNLYSAVTSLYRAARAGNCIDRIINPLALLCCVGALFIKELRRKPLVWISGIWIVTNILMLGINGYLPHRHYIPEAVGSFILLSVVFDFLLRTRKKSIVMIAMVFLISIYYLSNGFWIVRYMATPEYSFRDMAGQVQDVLNSRLRGNNIVLGHFANTIGVAIGTLSINDRRGTVSLEEKIQKYNPGCYVSLGAISPEIQTVLSKYGKVEYVGKHDVFNNYTTGEPVYIYELAPAMK